MESRLSDLWKMLVTDESLPPMSAIESIKRRCEEVEKCLGKIWGIKLVAKFKGVSEADEYKVLMQELVLKKESGKIKDIANWFKERTKILTK